MTEPNEQMARLLGWKRIEWQDADAHLNPGYKHTDGRTWWHAFPPHYDSWDRFPELQDYVRGLETTKQWAILMRVTEDNGPRDLFYLTPSILRDAIVEACGD